MLGSKMKLAEPLGAQRVAERDACLPKLQGPYCFCMIFEDLIEHQWELLVYYWCNTAAHRIEIRIIRQSSQPHTQLLFEDQLRMLYEELPVCIKWPDLFFRITEYLFHRSDV